MFFTTRSKILQLFPKDQQKALGRSYHDGEVFIREGEKDKHMFVVQSGQVEIFKTDQDRREVRLAILGSGETVGEMAMFDNAPRSASARAIGNNTRLLSLDRITLMRRIHEDPFLMLTIFEKSSDRIRTLSLELIKHIKMYNELSREHDAATRGLGILAKCGDKSDTKNPCHLVESLVTRTALTLKGLGSFPGQLDSGFIANLGLASNLRDVGNESIAKEILDKGGKLTEEEWKEVRKHVSVGAKAIQMAEARTPGVSFLSLAMEISEFHHERYDGTGYHGLKGEKIPLSARIVSIVDAYHALVSDRPHREKYSHKEALDVIKQETGTHFDPKVANAFFDAMAELDNPVSPVQ